MRKSYVYKIVCKITGEYYFGSSFNAKCDWYWGGGKLIRERIAQYGKENFIKEILEEFKDRTVAHQVENQYIEKFRNDEKCLNQQLDHKFDTYGEESRTKIGAANRGKHLSEERKAKIGAANAISHRGKHLSEEAKAKLSVAFRGENHPMYGKHLSEEHKAKISAGNRGKHRTEEVKARISAALRGKIVSDDTRSKLSASLKGLMSGDKNPMYGKHRTEETRAKISAGNRGKHRTEEARAKMSAAQRGKHFSEKHRARISESHLGIFRGKHWRKNTVTGKREWYD